MKVKVSEATPLQLDWMVAKCEGSWILSMDSFVPNHRLGRMRFTTDWAQGGPIIERELIGVTFHPEWEVPNWGAWRTDGDDHQEIMGETLLIAAMRCYVASKLGYEVEVPEELA